MIIPTSLASLQNHVTSFTDLLLNKGIPSPVTWGAYFSFFFVQILLAAIVPGLTMQGLPTAPDGKRLPYHCNGFLTYYICMGGFLFVHFLGIFPGTHLADHFGEALVAAMIIGDVTSLLWYFYGLYTTDPRNGKFKSSGSAVYDFFMGTILYPRIGEVDIKMIAECRWSWFTLMLITTSFALKQYELTGSITKEMGAIVFAHWLYSNATVKGEHCIPCTWGSFRSFLDT